jgi:hypothetical protein
MSGINYTQKINIPGIFGKGNQHTAVECKPAVRLLAL